MAAWLKSAHCCAGLSRRDSTRTPGGICRPPPISPRSSNSVCSRPSICPNCFSAASSASLSAEKYYEIRTNICNVTDLARLLHGQPGLPQALAQCPDAAVPHREPQDRHLALQSRVPSAQLLFNSLRLMLQDVGRRSVSRRQPS